SLRILRTLAVEQGRTRKLRTLPSPAELCYHLKRPAMEINDLARNVVLTGGSSGLGLEPFGNPGHPGAGAAQRPVRGCGVRPGIGAQDAGRGNGAPRAKGCQES